MAVRASMQALINRLRSATGAAEDDVFHGVTYWTDDQLQAELDNHKVELWAVPLEPINRRIEGNTVVLQAVFRIPRGFWVEDLYIVRDKSGYVFNGAYTVYVNEEHGTVTFAQNAGTAPLYIDLVAYDWNAAAASVWSQKAAHRFDYVPLKAADYRIDAQQEYRHCVERAEWHRRRRVKTFKQPKRGFVSELHQRQRKTR